MKRGETDLSLLVAINKPSGMTSHDVVNRCRRIFGEKRCGHTGTLDPLASGVLPICVGPATRLDKYLVGHRKTYVARIVLGTETTTGDAEGEVIAQAPLYAELLDEAYARAQVEALIGTHEQIPPVYSAVKVNGKKAYEQARKGEEVKLEPRKVEVHWADLCDIYESNDGSIEWLVIFEVSKGTYIRTLAQDLGRSLGCYAHLGGLERKRAGGISLDDCVSLETLEQLKTDVALDPVRVLGYRFAFADNISREISNGASVYTHALPLCKPYPDPHDEMCACTSSIMPSDDMPYDGELISVIVENKLKAIYRFDAKRNAWIADCVFSKGVARV